MMHNEKFVRLYQQKANKATRGHTREMYSGLASLGKHSTQAELERQLQEELRNIVHEKARKPDFVRICQRLLRQALKDLKQEENAE
jgi:hypothetical protein